MAMVVQKLYKSYNWLFYEVVDPRPSELGLFMMSSPWPTIIVSALYLYFVCNLGPRWMKNKKPFELNSLIMVYNIGQIIANIYIAYQAGLDAVASYPNWNCVPIDYSYSVRAVHSLRMFHLFYLTRFADLLDTVFFVLRKKNNQLSFLHIYHHWGTFLSLWVIINYAAGGYITWIGVLNGTVHAVMYTYYTLAAMDKSWSKNIAIKKFITQLQIVQFLIILFIFGRLLFIDCNFPIGFAYYFVIQDTVILTLFLNFYVKAYWRKKERKIN